MWEPPPPTSLSRDLRALDPGSKRSRVFLVTQILRAPELIVFVLSCYVIRAEGVHYSEGVASRCQPWSSAWPHKARSARACSGDAATGVRNR